VDTIVAVHIPSLTCDYTLVQTVRGGRLRHFDVDFSTIGSSKLQNEPHKLIDEWGNDRYLTWERLA